MVIYFGNNVVVEFLENQEPTFLFDGIAGLEHCWTEFIANGDNIEK